MPEYSYTGAVQTEDVSEFTAATATLTGGAGSHGGSSTGDNEGEGGRPGSIDVEIDLENIDELNIYVAEGFDRRLSSGESPDSIAGGWGLYNGGQGDPSDPSGGGGGGATAITDGSDNELVIADGGGGGQANSAGSGGGGGGARGGAAGAGFDSTAGEGEGFGGDGGDGGAGDGGNGGVEVIDDTIVTKVSSGTGGGGNGSVSATFSVSFTRSVSNGAIGSSTALRTVFKARSLATGTTSVSSATRQKTASRQTTTASDGVSAVDRLKTAARTLANGEIGASSAARAFKEWRLAGQQIDPTDDLVVTADSLTLSFESSRSKIDLWRGIGDTAGDISVEASFGGAFRAIPRGGGRIRVEPAARRRPPFKPSDFLVDSYEEEQISPGRFHVSFALQREANRDKSSENIVEKDGDWTITLQHGTLALSETQVGQIDREGAPAGATLTLPLRVSDKQAAALLDNLRYPDGVVERSVPDGPNQRVDETGGRQTIDVDAPAGAAIDSGEWYVTDWSLLFNSYSEGRTWLFELALAE